MCNHKCSICHINKRVCESLRVAAVEFTKQPLFTLSSPCYLNADLQIEEGDWYKEVAKLGHFFGIDLTYESYWRDAPVWLKEDEAATEEEIENSLRRMCVEYFTSKMEEVIESMIPDRGVPQWIS